MGVCLLLFVITGTVENRVILYTFEDLRMQEDKFGRIFYYFDKSPSRKKIVAREFVSSGNGWLWLCIWAGCYYLNIRKLYIKMDPCV
jgi:hypothetical protein